MPERYRDDEEAAYESSRLLASDVSSDDLRHGDDAPHISSERSGDIPQQTDNQARSSTEYLDGLRGLAAVWVFVQHFMPTFTMGMHDNGFGQDGMYLFVSLPYVRLFFGNGGNAAVVIFFVLSGYVLSISPLRKLRQEKTSDVRKGLLGAVIRRPIRLYVPALAISIIHACLLHIPGLFLPVPWLKPEDKTLGEEFAWWWEKTYDYFSLFREHGSHLFAYPYNVAMWTLPIEMNGSLVIYSTLAILSLGLRGPDPRAPTMVAVLLFFIGAVILQRFWTWYMAAFLFGMMLAITDVWPVGAELRGLFAWPRRSRGSRTTFEQKDSRASRIFQSWTNSLPEWAKKRLQGSGRESTRKSSFWAYTCFFVGFYLLSEPAHAGDKNFSLKTPGWVFLTKLIPEPYDELRYYRYWQTWGALLGVYSVLRIGWLQWFFTTKMLRFFGFTSFMLYLVHLPFFRVFPDRFNNLIGCNGDPNDFGSFWDKSWEIPDIGPIGMSSRFWVGFTVDFSSTLLLAWLATIAIDQPSVKLGKMVTRLIGLDRSKTQNQSGVASQATESTIIYSNDKDMEEVELQDVAYSDEHQVRS